MDISREGICELADYEGFSTRPYLDSGGVKTVGTGLTYSDIPDIGNWPWKVDRAIPDLISIYKDRLKKYVAAVNKTLVLLDIPQHQFDALVSLCYNIGVAGLEHSTAMKRVNAKSSIEQVVSAIKEWNKDNGKIVPGLINRRQAECNLFATGEYKSGGYVALIEVDDKHHPHYTKKIKLSDYL